MPRDITEERDFEPDPVYVSKNFEQNHNRYRSNLDLIKDLYRCSRVCWSAPQVLWLTTCNRFRAFVHFCFKCFMWEMKDSLRSNIIPRNLVSSTTGMGDPFRVSIGS